MHLDEFESQFKSAIKVPYTYEAISLGRVALVSDGDSAATQQLMENVNHFVPPLTEHSEPEWKAIGCEDFSTLSDLLSQLKEFNSDLVIAERNLKLDHADNLIYGLTNYVDALTQVLDVPVLLLPNREHDYIGTPYGAPKNIMVESNHLTGDNRLINWGVRFAEPAGSLFLTHIEDAVAFANTIEAISRIPEIDTDLAERTLRDTLLKLPNDFARSTTRQLSTQFPQMAVHEIVQFGSALSEYQSIIDDNHIDLLILNTKEEGQLAMNGIVYAMAVEFKYRPLLLL